MLPPLTLTGQMTLGLQTIDYTVTYRFRRSFGLRIDPRGLNILAPLGASRQAIQGVLLKKQRWILSKLQQVALRQSQIDNAARALAFGRQIPYLGEAITLTPGHVNDVDRLENRCLKLALAPNATEAAIVKRVQRWMKLEAAAYLPARIHHFGTLLGEFPNAWKLSSAKTRWGSCTSAKNIRLGWRLMHLPPAVIDYVVAHEVAHLRELNHSPAFWHIVELLYPNHRWARAQLKQVALLELPPI